MMQTQDLTTDLRNGHAKLARAVSVACDYHVAQVRKGTAIPYVSHLLQVAGLVLEHGGDLEQAAAGVLHDAIEDVPTARFEDIVAAVGPRAAAIVIECTDTSVGDSPEAKAPWADRKAKHLQHLEIVVTPDAALVIGCDKLHNLRSQVADLRHTGGTVKFNAPYAARRDVQRAAIAALRDKIPKRLFDDLCDAQEEWEQLHGRLPYAQEDSTP